MTDTDRERQALAESVRVFYDPDGTVEEQERTVEVRINYSEKDELRFKPDEMDNPDEVEDLAERYDPGELIDTEYYNGAYARLRYAVDDGTARLTSFKDAEPKRGEWVRFEFLRVIDAAETVVERLPFVDGVEPAEETVRGHISDGQGGTVEKA